MAVRTVGLGGELSEKGKIPTSAFTGNQRLLVLDPFIINAIDRGVYYKLFVIQSL